MMVAVLPPGAGGAGFLVEEEVDFRKFPESHLSFLPGRGRRNEIRQRQMGHTFTRAGEPPRHVKDQCEVKGFTNLSAPIRHTYIIKNFHL